MATVVFWSAVALIGYSYILYPLVLAAMVRILKGGQGECAPAKLTADLPDVACIVAAYNEECHIAARINNILQQSYAPGKLTMYVASDGSRDRTGSILAERCGPRVHAFNFEHNRGKATVLNELVAETSAPILVFSDANTLFDNDAVARLVARFADPQVGAVCGELKLLASGGSNQDSLYWRIEQFLKRSEARLGGLLGANGGIYAVRRELFRPIAPDTIVDDFCIAMTIAAEGRTLVYAPEAVAFEATPDDVSEEYHRRVRIGIGNYQAFFRHSEYLLRTNWATRFTYVSHKVLRWFTPHLMLLALAASAVLAVNSHFYLTVFLLQLAGYGAAALVWRFNWQSALHAPAAIVYFFLTLNWAFLVAFGRFVSGRYSGSWRTTVRGAEATHKSPV